MTVFSPSNEMTISLLLYPDRAPSRWEMAELEEGLGPYCPGSAQGDAQPKS